MRFDRATFFKEYRRQWGSLPQSRLDALEDLLPAIEDDDIRDVRYIAYMLATAAHETGWTFRPIHERGGRSYFNKYETGTKLGARLGNTQPGDGYRYRGRGFVQLTGRANYAKASRKLGVDFVADPDAVLDMRHAYQIMSTGMREGWFTGKSLAAYIGSGLPDYYNARRIINGLDRAADIAGYAKNFERILRAALIQDAPRAAAQAEDEAPEPTMPADAVEQEDAAVPVAAPPPAPPVVAQPPAVAVPAVAVDSSTGKKSLWATITGGLGLTALGGYFDTISEHADQLKNLPHSNDLIKIALIAAATVLCIYLLRQLVNGIFDRWSAHKLNEIQLRGAQSTTLQTAVLVQPPAVAVAEEKQS